MSKSPFEQPAPDRSGERWARTKDVLGRLLEQERSSWPTFLVEQCGDDVELFLDLACLARLSPYLDSFLEQPAFRRVLK